MRLAGLFLAMSVALTACGDSTPPAPAPESVLADAEKRLAELQAAYDARQYLKVTDPADAWASKLTSLIVDAPIRPCSTNYNKTAFLKERLSYLETASKFRVGGTTPISAKQFVEEAYMFRNARRNLETLPCGGRADFPAEYSEAMKRHIEDDIASTAKVIDASLGQGTFAKLTGQHDAQVLGYSQTEDQVDICVRETMADKRASANVKRAEIEAICRAMLKKP